MDVPHISSWQSPRKVFWENRKTITAYPTTPQYENLLDFGCDTFHDESSFSKLYDSFLIIGNIGIIYLS